MSPTPPPPPVCGNFHFLYQKKVAATCSSLLYLFQQTQANLLHSLSCQLQKIAFKISRHYKLKLSVWMCFRECQIMATHEDKLSKKSSTRYIDPAWGTELHFHRGMSVTWRDQTQAQKPGGQNLKTRQSQIRYEYMHNYNSICPS